MRNDINPISALFRSLLTTTVAVGLFSGVMNLIMLAGPIFMLQIYDRVLSSRSVPTLLTLFALVVFLYLFFAILDFLRSRIFSRIGFRLASELGDKVMRGRLAEGLAGRAAKTNPRADLAQLRQFMDTSAASHLFDLPWVPVYLGFVFLLNFWLGVLATGGLAVVVVATCLNEALVRQSVRKSSAWEAAENQFEDAARKEAEAIHAMGMRASVIAYWQRIEENAFKFSQAASNRNAATASITKAIRMLLQSAMLALGAYLAIYQEITPGAMIAASIIAGRALAPVDGLIAQWRNIVRARQSYAALKDMLQQSPERPAPTALPAPQAHVTVECLTKRVSGEGKTAAEPALQGIHFALEPGDALGVLGPSASGKSTLARLLVGLMVPERGSVRLDGALLSQWSESDLGRYVGYLPQSVSLLPGTIRQNIARFDDTVSDEEVVAAAKLAGVHDLILSLPNGYDSRIGNGGQYLSGGQIQRLALARAVLRCPALLVLDEPNANLDAAGDEALAAAITSLREKGCCVIVMTHRPSAMRAVNKLLVLNAGRQVAFGARDQVLKQTVQPLSASKASHNSDQASTSSVTSVTSVTSGASYEQAANVR